MPQFRLSIGRQHGRSAFCPPALNQHGQQNDLLHEGATKYQCDVTFTNVSMSLLARYEQLNLTAKESIQATLDSDEERSAFYEALCHRKCQIQTKAPHASSFILQKIDQAFGAELRHLCRQGKEATVPLTPRNDSNPSRSFCNGLQQEPNPRKSTQSSCFFPDSGPRSCGYLMRKKVQNLDFDLTEALDQVMSLSLNGTNTTEGQSFPCYESSRAV